MSVLVLNAGPTISVCCVVYVPDPSAYQLQSLSLPSSIYSYSPIPLSVAKVCVLSHTFSTTYILCVPKGNSHLLTFPSAHPHCKTRTGAVMVTWLSVRLCSQLWHRLRSPKAGVGSHSRCLNMQLLDNTGCFLEIGLQRRSTCQHTLSDLDVLSASGGLMVTFLGGGGHSQWLLHTQPVLRPQQMAYQMFYTAVFGCVV
jgi:hypothetical protein